MRRYKPDEPGRNSLRVLYISYDGVLEPLGQSQILPYLEELSREGVTFTLLTFEKVGDVVPGSVTFERTQKRLTTSGICWVPLRYHKRPAVLAKSFDLLVGMWMAVVIAIKDRVGVVHCRGYVPALMGWLLKRMLGTRFLFDMRGFWADERVDGGLWPPGGFLYRLAKRMEQRFLLDADEIVTLTERARSVVERCREAGACRISVIPTCVDLERFSASARSLVPDPSPILIYTGSVGTWYLLDEMLDLYVLARRRYPGAKFNLLTRNRAEASRVLGRRGFGPPTLTCTDVPPDEVPGWLTHAHLGLAFYKTGWGRQGTCPTKIGEYLAMGLPVLVNDAVGDVKQVIGTNGVGVVLSDFSTAEYENALDQLERLWADPTLASRCRRIAESYFSLQLGVDRYWAIYQRLGRSLSLTP